MWYQKENSITLDRFECIRYADIHFNLHMHRHPELVYIRQGTVLVECGGKTETICAGECALIPSNGIHGYRSCGPSVSDVCIFSEAYVPTFSRQIRRKKAEQTKFVCSAVTRTFAEEKLFLPNQTPDLYTLKATLYAVLGEYLQQVPLHECSEKSELLMQRIIDYVERNYTENITLKSMAEELGYEEHYLSRCFHNLVPMHFSRYVNYYRVDAAAGLLRSTELSITEIALQSGFQSIRSFNRVYRDLTGHAPSDRLYNPSVIQ